MEDKQLRISQEEIQDIQNWLPGQEQVDEFKRQLLNDQFQLQKVTVSPTILDKEKYVPYKTMTLEVKVNMEAQLTGFTYEEECEALGHAIAEGMKKTGKLLS